MQRLGGLGLLLLALSGCGGSDGTGSGRDDGKTPGGTVEIDGLKSAVPASWKAEPTANQFRLAQFRVGTDVTVVVFQGIGGSAEAG